MIESSFGDFCEDVLWRNGIALGLYRGRKYPLSRLGAELIYQERVDDGLHFETQNGHGVPSGIYGESWLCVIGNYHVVWIFGTKTLRLLFETGRYNVVEADGKKWFMLSREDAEKYCLKKIDGKDLTGYFVDGEEELPDDEVSQEFQSMRF